MKVKVVNRFVDKETKELHEYGDIIEVTKARFDEITSVGRYVEAIKVSTKKAENIETIKTAEAAE